jgi:hypothetical protein
MILVETCFWFPTPSNVSFGKTGPLLPGAPK